jgi:hypothetical protein
MWMPRRLTTLWAFTACYTNDFTFFFFSFESRDSSVGIKTGYRLDSSGTGIQYPAKAMDIFLFYSVHTGSGAHPTSYPMSTGSLSSVVKIRRHEDSYHLHVSSVEIKNTWMSTATPPYVFMAWRLINSTEGYFFLYIL